MASFSMASSSACSNSSAEIGGWLGATTADGRTVAASVLDSLRSANQGSAPLAWWGMHSWMQSFAFRTAISWWVFLLAGVLATTSLVLRYRRSRGYERLQMRWFVFSARV